MNLIKLNHHVIKITSVIRLILLVTILFLGVTGCKPKFVIENPYAEVNWEEYGRYKANLHTHTSRSDGYFSPQVVVDRYHEMGYEILAISDHNFVTYPWQEFSSFEASSRTYKRLEDGQLKDIPAGDVFIYENRDPDSIGMIAIQACEVSQHHHLLSYFNDHPGGELKTASESMQAIAEKNGLAVLAHPGSYNGTHRTRKLHPIDWYVDLYQRYENLIGMEAFNNGLNYYPGNFHRWDSTLTRLMPDRPVWGFSNDDFHGGIIGRNWNVFLLPELSVEQVRYAMEHGLFYYVYDPEGHKGVSPPEILSVDVNSEKGIINIQATGYEHIEWISDGEVIYKGNPIDLTDIPKVGNYVRAAIYQSEKGAVTGTQPFGIRRKGGK